MGKPIKWKLKIEHLMACNCNYGCPCSFNAPPTHGACEAALAYRVVEGKYGAVPLDGLRWVFEPNSPGERRRVRLQLSRPHRNRHAEHLARAVMPIRCRMFRPL